MLTKRNKSIDPDNQPEEELPGTPSTPPYVNITTKRHPKRSSPLANEWVAAGHFYDMSTGLVKPFPKAPIIEEEK